MLDNSSLPETDASSMCYLFISYPCSKNNLIYFAEIHKIQPAKNKYNGEIISKGKERIGKSSLLKVPMLEPHGKVKEVSIFQKESSGETVIYHKHNFITGSLTANIVGNT